MFLLVKHDAETNSYTQLDSDGPVKFASKKEALDMAANYYLLCNDHDIRMIWVSPRILPKKYQPRQVKMVFGAGE